MKRRAFFLAALAAVSVLAACKTEPRCKTCGMRIDRASPWRAEIAGPGSDVVQFDSPRCALRAYVTDITEGRKRGGGPRVRRVLRVQEYYDRTFRAGEDVRFVAGGDVTGPMGPDLVPVDPGRVTKFVQDHGADRAYSLGEITLDIVNK
jgi:hypothetical protein